MLELTGLAPLYHALDYAYWLLAIIAIAAAVRLPGTRKRKVAISTVVALLLAIPPATAWLEYRKRQAYAEAAWAHFRKLCAERAGEKIYKTYTGVKSLLVLKPLPAATEQDLYDQYWMGNPYSTANIGPDRGVRLASTLLRDREFTHQWGERGFEFVEILLDAGRKDQVTRLDPLDVPPFLVQTIVAKPVSTIGLEWNDISTQEERKYWIAASRLRVIDLADNSVIAERTGFVIEPGFGSRARQRRPWQVARVPHATCPEIRNGTFEDRWFVHRAITPHKEQGNGK